MTVPSAAPEPAPELDVAPAAETAEPVLVVDLDGTLSRTDTLIEAVLGLAARRPMALFKLPFWLSGGRAAFKARVAEAHIVPGDALPLNETVLEEIRRARAAGRRTALVTAADQRQAEAVAEAAGLFDEVHGSSGARNLKGAEKARFLTERFGEKGFDYIGDSKADLPVWAAARAGLTVGAEPGLRRRAEAANPEMRHLDAPTGKTLAALKAMRPHQWSKNLLLFVPALAAHNSWVLWAVAWGFLAFSATASAVYLINDLLDLEADRAHPRKRRRPFAAGDLSPVTGLGLAAGLLVFAFAIAAAIGSPAFFATLAVYLAATFAYSLVLKRELLIDVLMLAGLYTVRIVAGGAVAGLVLSPWLLGFSMFVFLALAAVKRQAELMDQLATGRESSGRAYEVEDLPILRALAMASGVASILVLALYIASPDVQPHYNHPTLLWLLCPVVLYWVMRMIMMAHRGAMTDDPIVFAAADRTSQIVVATAGLIVLVAAFA
ncbi:MAG: UbiA family prenyltransferase [Pseudomonadota bacterium]